MNKTFKTPNPEWIKNMSSSIVGKPLLGIPYPEKQEKLEKAFKLMQELTVNCFWGTLSFTLESGKIVHVKEEKSLKL